MLMIVAIMEYPNAMSSTSAMFLSAQQADKKLPLSFSLEGTCLSASVCDSMRMLINGAESSFDPGKHDSGINTPTYLTSDSHPIVLLFCRLTMCMFVNTTQR